MLLPNHYYAPVADVLDLEESKQYWARRSSMLGIDVDLRRQGELLRQTVMPFQAEYFGNRAFLEGQERGYGPGFGFIEAQCYHGVLRALKPRRIIEVGAGVSTHCAQEALRLNGAGGAVAAITVIEPYPSDFLRRSGVQLIEDQVQRVAPSIFESLTAGDILFIDSTHAVKPGGDVVYLYLEVLPRLKPGVVVHIHDIYFPYLHQPDLLHTLFQWNETALLQALMTSNPRLSILFCLSHLHYDAPALLREVFPEYTPAPTLPTGLNPADGKGHFPASIYLRVN